MLEQDPFKERAPTNEELHFRALFGCSVAVVTIGWNRMLELDLLPEKAEIKHYLWTLAWCKVYPTDKAASKLFGVDPKTWKKWIDLMLNAITDLEGLVVRLQTNTNGRNVQQS